MKLKANFQGKGQEEARSQLDLPITVATGPLDNPTRVRGKKAVGD